MKKNKQALSVAYQAKSGALEFEVTVCTRLFGRLRRRWQQFLM